MESMNRKERRDEEKAARLHRKKYIRNHDSKPLSLRAILLLVAATSLILVCVVPAIFGGNQTEANTGDNSDTAITDNASTDIDSSADHGDAVSGGVDGEENGTETTESAYDGANAKAKVMQTAYTITAKNDKSVPAEAWGELSKTTVKVPFFIGDAEMALGTCTYDRKNGVNRVLVTDEVNFTLLLDGTITKYCDGRDDGHSHCPEWGLPNGKVLQAYAGRGMMVTDGDGGKFVGNKHPNQVPVFTSPESYFFAVPVKGLAEGLSYQLERKAPSYDESGKLTDPGYIRLTKMSAYV